MSNKIFNSDSSSSLNPTDKFEKIFLILASNEPISNPQEIEINEKTPYGTGFFIKKNGLFLSVAHNFHNENKDNYEYVYAILKNQKGEFTLKEIQKNKIQIDIDKDYAVGKIDVNCYCLNYKLYKQEEKGTVHGLKDKRLIGVLEYDFFTYSSAIRPDIGDVPMSVNKNSIPKPKENISNMPTNYYKKLDTSKYFKNDNLTFYNHSISFNIIRFDQNIRQYETKHEFKEICWISESGEIDYFQFGKGKTPLSGLSGSPFMDNKKVIGLHARGKKDYEKLAFTYNYMIPIDKTFDRFIKEYIQKI